MKERGIVESLLRRFSTSSNKRLRTKSRGVVEGASEEGEEGEEEERAGERIM